MQVFERWKKLHRHLDFGFDSLAIFQGPKKRKVSPFSKKQRKRTEKRLLPSTKIFEYLTLLNFFTCATIWSQKFVVKKKYHIPELDKAGVL